MKEKTLTIQYELSGQNFRDYAVFDTFSRRKKWRSPAIFAAILCVFAAVCFAFQHLARGAVLLGCVLLVIALGLPAFYVGSYLRSVGKQAKKMDAAGKRTIFTLRLGAEGPVLSREGQEQSWTWAELEYVYRLPELLCIYPTPQQAFLAAGTQEKLDAAWAVCREKLPPEKVIDRRKGRRA